MRRSERLQDMLQYTNEKKQFNLKDLIEKYRISRSTAIRDVQALEMLGMPIYAEHGRNGKYVVLDNRILSPITFTADELYAIYFAMLTLSGYKETPFEQEINSLEETFQSVLPSGIKDRVKKMKDSVKLDTPSHSNEAPYLKEILKGIIDEKVYTISYRKEDSRNMTVQFVTLQAKFGQWYAKIYNMNSSRVQTIRCDKILQMRESEEKQPRELQYLLSLLQTYHHQPGATMFTVEVTERGKDLYDKESYPSMSLTKTGNIYTISGYYNTNEEAFITDYIIRFGKSILSIEPSELRAAIQGELKSLVTHMEKLN
ncbi:helix-turn-helix transcriptional regulator [Terribacillus saccharophilus]|uniref:Alkaline phosphatase n=1 Tax=Terribacillus saccharophilus TaxID=361277 RepID=A0A268ABM4_9BACI|nr:WYL domain-containing protein [Terribacillus saccharophilus]PAD21512.1 alkaline phosphatase [Terribacillus saccharophilus]